ncbi:unnamed protein product, partial [Rotaria sp. Silwood2]
IAISELDPTGTNATAKKSDSEKINGIIQHCSKELVLALVNFYAPIIDLTQWITLLNLVLDEVIVIIRDIAWNEAIFIVNHPKTKKGTIYFMDRNAWMLEKTLVVTSPIFETLRQYERSFPFEHFCTVVPWGCVK